MKRFWILAGAFAATAAIFGLAFLLGTWGFEYRRYSQHQRRLQRVVEQEPTIDRLTLGLAEEGAAVLAAPETPEEADRLILAHGGDRVTEMREKLERWGHLVVYRAADMLYFVFFDDDQVMRDFTCVGARGGTPERARGTGTAASPQ